MKPLKPFDISLNGINLVEASAGTGKTYNITSLYIRALIELDIPVKKILVVTYTEAATKELKDRLLSRIRESLTVLKTQKLKDKSDQFLNDLLHQVTDFKKAIQNLEIAVREFDESAVYTIHGFCYQALQEQAFESRMLYDSEMIGDDSDIILEVVDDYWRNWISEITEDWEKYPLFELISSNGYHPEKLAEELGQYIGKPYLQILPEDIDTEAIEDSLSEFRELYRTLSEIWSEDADQLFELLDSGDLSYYTTNKLSSWFDLMEEFLGDDTPRLSRFTQFYRFRQSRIDESLKKKAVKDGVRPPQHEFFKLTDEFVRVTESIKKYVIAFKKELLLHLRDETKERKEQLQALSYDDLLLRLQKALQDDRRGELLCNQLRNKYPLAFVDEFQDTDPVQYDIFRRIYNTGEEDTALFLIGDPKQSIYSFRGADVFSYLKASRDAPKENLFKLEKNFRSGPRLIKGLNTLWGNHNNPFIISDISYNNISWGRNKKDYDVLLEYGKQHPAIRFRMLSDDQQNKTSAAEAAAMDTADEIYRLIQDGKKGEITIGSDYVKAKDIAVLVRTHKQANLVREALQEKGVKSVQYSQESVFQSNEARYLQTFLKAVTEPSSERLIKTALSLPLTAFTANDLLNIEEDQGRWISVLDKFSKWHSIWQEQGFAPMFRTVLQEAGILVHLIRLPDGERRLTNIQHLGELLQEESQKQKEGARGLLKWLSRKREDADTQQDEEQLRLESDSELVKIVTMHRSKGLEYSIVFCPFLWYGPRYSDSGQPLVYHGSDDKENTYLDLTGKLNPERNEHRFQALREELAESLRLAYVAMTRAKYSLYISCHHENGTEFSALGYLFGDLRQTEELLRNKLSDQKYQKPDGSEMFDIIEEFCDAYPDLFTKNSELKKSGSQLNLLNGEESRALEAAEFKRAIPLRTGYKVSSFSSLTSWMDDDPDAPDYDQFLYVSESDSSPEPGGIQEVQNMFTFPKGPQPGTTIHNIFENIDFSDSVNFEETIREQLLAFGIDQKWVGTVKNMLNIVLHKPLLPDERALTLSALDPEDLIPEMEFYYKNESLEANKLLSIIREDEDLRRGQGGRADSGFLKGFIDLTFRFGGKYYLLDYKTNYLGDSIADYEQKYLAEEMHAASYDLQYHIYTIALHRFLKKKLPDYSYEQNFGGAFYLFLRGINKKGREGIFFDCPSEKVIKKLDRYIWEGGV